MILKALAGALVFFSSALFAGEPSPAPSAEPVFVPANQYAIVWGGGKKPVDAALALRRYKRDFDLFKGSVSSVEGFPLVLSGGRVKGLDTNDQVVLLGYCNDEQVKATIGFYQSFHPAAYARKIDSDRDGDHCPYPSGFDNFKAGPRVKAGKLTFNIVAYGAMTVAYLWNANEEIVQSRRIEVAESNDLTQDIGCVLSLDPEQPDRVLATCEARRTHTAGIASLKGHFKVSANSGRLRLEWTQEKKVMDVGD